MVFDDTFAAVLYSHAHEHMQQYCGATGGQVAYRYSCTHFSPALALIGGLVPRVSDLVTAPSSEQQGQGDSIEAEGDSMLRVADMFADGGMSVRSDMTVSSRNEELTMIVKSFNAHQSHQSSDALVGFDRSGYNGSASVFQHLECEATEAEVVTWANSFAP